jgi:hypothetical protein
MGISGNAGKGCCVESLESSSQSVGLGVDGAKLYPSGSTGKRPVCSAHGGVHESDCAALSTLRGRGIIADRPDSNRHQRAEHVHGETDGRRLGLSPRCGSLTTEQCAKGVSVPRIERRDLQNVFGICRTHSQRCQLLRKGRSEAPAVIACCLQQVDNHMSNQARGFTTPGPNTQTLH